MQTELFLNLYRFMLTARKEDELEKSLAQRGEVPFYVSSSGHEAMAALAPHLGKADWLHPHYRDKALLLARGIPVDSFLHTLFGRAESSSGGRRMPGFSYDPGLNVLSACTLVGNNALQAVGVAAAIKDDPEQPIVYCALGDGGTQEGEVLEAIAEAVRSQLPVLFVIQDNRFALSTPTAGKTFYSLPDGDAEDFYGLQIHRVDGTDAVATHEAMGAVVEATRKTRGPQVVLLNVERLVSHTNSDDHRMYREEDEIARIREHADPLRNLGQRLLKEGVSQEDLNSIEHEVEQTVTDALKTARAGTEPVAVLDAKKPLPPSSVDAAAEYRGKDDDLSLSMLEAMRESLRNHLGANGKISLYGEDIEDPKGDVFGLTRGLTDQFPGQVRNSPLTESTIVGVSIGRALAGEQPVAFLQFSDFLPLAYNQILTELGSMHWRTAGNCDCPVIVMAISGAYRPGLGPFHAQSPVAAAAHVPGVDVFMPSNAADAAGLLNAAFASGRPSIFFYPKNLLNDRDVVTSDDIDKHFVPIGKARVTRQGRHITLVSWGSTMPICERVAAALDETGVYAEVIDLRTVYPWDKDTVLASAEKTGRLLVVHEDNHTCGMGGEIVATVAEEAAKPVTVARVAQADTYVPYHFGNQMDVLPSFKSVLTRAAEMLDMDLEWEEAVKTEAGHVVVNAIGSSPSDETITITELHVGDGEGVKEGDLIASVEADKATMDISAPVDGTIDEFFLSVGDVVRVGTPLIRIKASDESVAQSTAYEEPGRPKLEKRRSAKAGRPALPEADIRTKQKVILSSIHSAVGSREMKNDDLVRMCPGWSSADIVKRTGIQHRHWIGEGESALTLGVDACRRLLAAENLDISEIDAIICSTGTPLSTTPSLACRILKELSPQSGELMMQAHDINAACSGYLYALQGAYDLLQHNPGHKILVVTSETLSPVLDSKDPQTFFLFGDAATASLISCEKRSGNINTIVRRPHVSALGAEEKILYVPSIQSREFLEMDGKPVFRIAVRKMIDMLDRACSTEGMSVDDLAMIVPHQANERIIEAIRKAIKFPTDKVFYFIKEYGNTSSNTIPLSLEALSSKFPSGDKVGMTAFGGGFTFAAGILEVL